MLSRTETDLVLYFSVAEAVAIDLVLFKDFLTSSEAHNQRPNASRPGRHQTIGAGACHEKGRMRFLHGRGMDRPPWNLHIFSVVLDEAVLEDFGDEIHHLIDLRGGVIDLV